MTSLAIVIVSYNARTDLERCLESLEQQPPGLPHDIIVVDNGSTDGSVQAVRPRWPRVRVIEAGRNLGFARASNLGIRASHTNLILLLNSDTVVSSGAIDAMIRVLDTHVDVAIVGPRLVSEQGRVEISFGQMLGPLVELRQKLLGWAYDRGMGWVSRYVERRASREQFPDWVSGACLLVRRAEAEGVGLLDERFFMYGEDVDFCAAVRRRGRRVLFTPAAEIIHLRGRSAARDPAGTEAAYRRSQLAFYEKHHPRWLPLLRAYLRVRGKLPARDAGAPTKSHGLRDP